MKLSYKILLIYVVVGLLILLSIGSFVSSRLKKERFSTIYRGIQNELAHVDFALNSYFYQVEEDLNDLVSDETVRSRDDKKFTNFTEAAPDTFQYAIGAPEQKIINIFNRYRQTHKYVNSVYMGRENGSFVRSHKRARPTKYTALVHVGQGKSGPGHANPSVYFRNLSGCQHRNGQGAPGRKRGDLRGGGH